MKYVYILVAVEMLAACERKGVIPSATPTTETTPGSTTGITAATPSPTP
jgi:hypothetical protein